MIKRREYNASYWLAKWQQQMEKAYYLTFVATYSSEQPNSEIRIWFHCRFLMLFLDLLFGIDYTNQKKETNVFESCTVHSVD